MSTKLDFLNSMYLPPYLMEYNNDSTLSVTLCSFISIKRYYSQKLHHSIHYITMKSLLFLSLVLSIVSGLTMTIKSGKESCIWEMGKVGDQLYASYEVTKGESKNLIVIVNLFLFCRSYRLRMKTLSNFILHLEKALMTLVIHLIVSFVLLCAFLARGLRTLVFLFAIN